MASEDSNSPIDLSESVALRPVTPADAGFVKKVYASTRADEMAATGWLDVEHRVFIEMQFKLQQQGYREQFPNVDHDLILLDDQPIGALLVDRASDEIRCVSLDAALCAFDIVGAYVQVSLLNECEFKLWTMLQP